MTELSALRALALAALLAAACSALDPRQAAGQQPAAADPVAKVNGQPVGREALTGRLVEAYGKPMLQALVALEVVRQAAKDKKLAVTPADIAAEEARSYPEEVKNMSLAERDKLLDDYLARNNLTLVHWRLAVERNAYLRRLAEESTPPPAEGVAQELFRRTYGEKVQIRHMQLDAPADVRKAEERLKKGESFEAVARDMSTNKAAAAKGGLLEPFDIKEPALPEEIRQVAFSLQKPDQVSGQILVRGRYHLIQLVKRIPPDNVKFEEVKDKLTRELHEHDIRVQMNYLLRMLSAAANIEILDPVIRAQAERAAPQAGPVPGSPPDR